MPSNRPTISGRSSVKDMDKEARMRAIEEAALAQEATNLGLAPSVVEEPQAPVKTTTPAVHGSLESILAMIPAFDPAEIGKRTSFIMNMRGEVKAKLSLLAMLDKHKKATMTSIAEEAIDRYVTDELRKRGYDI